MDNSANEDIENFNIFKLAEEGCYHLLDIVLENLEIYKFHVNSQDENGNTLLHLISGKGNYEFAKKLINLGSNVNITNNINETPLHSACTTGDLNLVKLLVGNNARTNTKDKTGENPIFKAMKHGHLSIIKYLKTNPEYFGDVNHEQENLIHAAVSSGNVSLVDYLMKIGNFDVNAQMLDGSTPLHLALKLKTNSFNMIKELAKNGADPHVRDAKSRNLLHLSVEKKSLEICKFLIDRGICVSDQDFNGATPLHYAVDLQLQSITFLLVHNGADVDKPDADGYTPLHLASRTNSELVEFLLRNKALNDVKTFNGDSPLHLAASSGNFGAVVVLLNGGCRANDLNNDNYSPVQLAEINGHGKVLKLLLEHCGSSASFRQLSKIPRAVRNRKMRVNSSRSATFNFSVIRDTTSL